MCAESFSVNHTFPSGPEASPATPVLLPGTLTLWSPPGLIFPSLVLMMSLTHTFPSGPCLAAYRSAVGSGYGNTRVIPSVVMRTTAGPCSSVNQRFPSNPTVIWVGKQHVPVAYSVSPPSVVILPMRFASSSVNHSAPSGPATMSHGWENAETKYSVRWPSVVSLPTRVVPSGAGSFSVNQMFPSVPTVIPYGALSFRILYSVTCPSGVILPTVPAPDSVNHRFPSGPATIWYGRLPGEGTVNSVTRLPGAAPAVLPGIEITAATARAAANTFRRCFMNCSLQTVWRRTIPQERPVDRGERSGAA